MNILVTGGSGFIGSHLIDALIERGHDVTSLDREPPSYPNQKAEYILEDVCNPLDGVMKRKFDAIYHMAAEVGSGLSMADPYKFLFTNSAGTANLLESMRSSGKLAKVIVASSATVYGEATYRCPEHGLFYPVPRPVEQLEKSEWEVKCPDCGKDTEAQPIQEDRVLNPTNIYGVSKLEQEFTCILLGRTWGFPAVAFRPFGVFGPRQSLGNPYTGVLALFATRVFAGEPIMHYEDGKQNKGYIYIEDAIRALILALERESANGKILNLGSGKPVTIRHIAEKLVERIDSSVEIICTGKFRSSDTRHSWCDNTLAQTVLNWKPEFSFEEGLNRMIEWLRTLNTEEIKDSMKTFEKAEKYAKSFGLEV